MSESEGFWSRDLKHGGHVFMTISLVLANTILWLAAVLLIVHGNTKKSLMRQYQLLAALYVPNVGAFWLPTPVNLPILVVKIDPFSCLFRSLLS